MLPFSLDELTENFFQQICEEQWSETQTLEFKALPPLSDDAAKQEFRKDVCALANAEGGDLVYGISEKGGKANAILSINGSVFDSLKRRLRQILESKVEPRIQGIQFHQCPLSGGGFVLVIRVPTSYDGPHRFGSVTEHRFAIRSDSATTDMTYDQLRNAFGRGATLLEKAARLRTHRLDVIASSRAPRRLTPGPILALHFIPICGLADRADVDIAGLHSDYSALMPSNDYSWTRAANIDGLVMYPYDDENGVECCRQVFRNGTLEILQNVSVEPRTPNEPTGVSGQWVGDELQSGLRTYVKAASRFGVSGPVVVSMSLVGTAGTLLATNNRSSTRHPIVDNRLDLPETMIDDITGNLDIDAITRPMLDVLYQCYGQPRCSLFDSAGKWSPPR